MTAWSRERPTVPGFYKWRRLPKWKSFEVEVIREGDGLEIWWLGAKCGYLNDDTTGEWQGPLEPKG